MGCNLSILTSVKSNPLHDDELMTKTKDNTHYMTFKDQTFQAKIVYVYDGDTVHVVFKVFGTYYRWNCRIIGVDTPELHTKNEKEKAKGTMVRDEVKKYFLHKIVTIHCQQFDKYGRLLIDIDMPIDVPNKNKDKLYSNWLISNDYAYAYDGGTKKKWDL